MPSGRGGREDWGWWPGEEREREKSDGSKQRERERERERERVGKMSNGS